MTERRSPWKKAVARQLAIVAVTLLVFELAIRIYDATSGRGFSSSDRNLIAKAVGVRPFRNFGPDYYTELEGVRYGRARWMDSTEFDVVPGRSSIRPGVVYRANERLKGDRDCFCQCCHHVRGFERESDG